MKVIFLGTNGWYSTPTGDTPCILIDSKDHYVIFDAGNGIYKLDQYITEDKPISLFISHFHLDHVSGLHILSKFNFKQGIDIYVGANRSKDFQTLVQPPYTVSIENVPENIINLKTQIRLRELGEHEENIPFKAVAIKQFHGYIDHGYRVELEGKTIAYTGDCGLTDTTKKLTSNADLLIAECSNRKTPEENWGHLTPELAANLANEMRVKKVILTHFGPEEYPTLDDRRWAEEEARKVFPATTAAMDGMEFEL